MWIKIPHDVATTGPVGTLTCASVLKFGRRTHTAVVGIDGDGIEESTIYKTVNPTETTTIWVSTDSVLSSE